MKETTIIKIVLSALFLICLADMPYGYFQVVRFLGLIGFGYLAYQEYELENNNWMLFYVCSAILINPIFKISLGRELWNLVDVAWAIVLIRTLIINKNK
jgi:hypothetical protein